MRRRDFLKLAGGAVAGLTVAAAADVFGLRSAASAAPGNGNRVHDHASGGGRVVVLDSFRWKGRRIQIIRRGDQILMRLDGRELDHHFFNQSDGVFRSHLLPYTQETQARALAKAIVDEDGALYRLRA